MKRLSGILFALVLLSSLTAMGLPLPVLAQPSEVWVDDDYCDGCPNDGHTWGYDAFDKIQDGIDAVASSIVHVAAGDYESITLKDGVQVLGAGADVTTIDGGGSGSVVTAIGVGSETVLDGFAITNGSADRGGGMFNQNSSPTVTNCTFYNNSAWDAGGGMFNDASSPTVTNCTFSGNSAGWGGGMHNWESSPTVTACTFSGNSASNGGGAMHNHDYSSPTVTNCIFWSNSSTMGWGGGMHNDGDSSPTVINCTFSGNSGGGMNNWDSSPIVTNCILWDNGYEIANHGTSTPLVTYCDIQGGYPGEGNISAHPMFVDPTGGDYHLQAGSPCIDAGTNVGAPLEDIEGNPRPIDGDGDDTAITDMGAYEYTPPTTMRCTPKFFFLVAREDGENPPSRTLTIYNFGAKGCAPLEWTVSAGANWTTLSPESGTKMRTIPGDQVGVSVDISDMSAGFYYTWITIEAPGATNTPQQVPVILYILPSRSSLPW